MGLKIIIVVLFIGVLISLTSGLYFLLKDFGKTDSQRMRFALSIRVILAGLLMSTIYYGISTGQLKNQAPWDSKINTSDAPETQK